MKIRLMMHDDWEVYGDGSGDPNKLMFEPAQRVLDICDKFGARYTFFAEMGQQFAMLDSTDVIQRNLAKKWERILCDAIKRGHDVQLHFHPLWIGAKYKDHRWVLDFSRWSVGELSAEDLESWLRRAVDYLNGLLSKYRADYRVVAFRAGNWMAQPSDNLLKVLRHLDIPCDVTVVKGMRLSNNGVERIDFRSAPSSVAPWFPAEEDVAKEVAPFSGIFCMPTYSEITSIPTMLQELMRTPRSLPFVLSRFLKQRHETYVPLHLRSNQGATLPPESFWKLFSQKRVLTCDFGRLYYQTIIQMIGRAKKLAVTEGLSELPLIMYTHSKTFHSYGNLKNLLQSLSRCKDLSFERTQTVVENLNREYLATNLVAANI